MSELPTLRETVEQYGLLAKKSLGQNFLLDMNITNKIVRTSLEAQHKIDFSGERVYEVGPGPGGLTRAVLQANPQKLTVIEMDTRCIQIMRDIQNIVGEQLEIVEGDALDSTMNPAEDKKTEDVETLIKQVNSMMNTFTDDQLDYANKAIADKDVKKLKIIIASKKAK
jgi:phospholipid N-methyltransferase